MTVMVIIVMVTMALTIMMTVTTNMLVFVCNCEQTRVDGMSLCLRCGICARRRWGGGGAPFSRRNSLPSETYNVIDDD